MLQIQSTRNPSKVQQKINNDSSLLQETIVSTEEMKNNDISSKKTTISIKQYQRNQRRNRLALKWYKKQLQ